MAYEYMGHTLRDRLDEKIQPPRTAVLVVGMQNDFVHDNGHCAKSFGLPMVSGFQSVVTPIARLARAARAAGAPVIYTKVVQLPDGSLASPVVTGVAGSGCVLSTVRDAIERDYFTIVEAPLAPEDFTTLGDVVAVWGQPA